MVWDLKVLFTLLLLLLPLFSRNANNQTSFDLINQLFNQVEAVANFVLHFKNKSLIIEMVKRLRTPDKTLGRSEVLQVH